MCKKTSTDKACGQNKKTKKNKSKYELIEAPTNMSLKSNFDEVVNFFNVLREKTTGEQKGSPVKVNFQNISKLKPGAALILAAELYRWQELNKIKLKPYQPERWDNDVNRLLNELGLFELLQTPPKFRKKNFTSSGSQIFFKFITGTTSDGELANTLMEKMSPVIDSHYNESLLYDALSEAMTNVLHHAYPIDSDVFDSDLKNRWWLSGSFDKNTKIMTVLLYDQGVGIPATLPNRKDWYDNVVRSLKEKKYSILNQGKLIQAAVKDGRSVTREGHRGKGLKQVLKFSSDSRFGRLHIISRKGEYFFSEACMEETSNCPVELGGTFISPK